MKTTNIYTCETCGESFAEAKVAQNHEENCLKLEVGHRVVFDYGLLTGIKGEVTHLFPPKPLKVGESATVIIRADEIIEEVDALHTGREVYVSRGSVWLENPVPA